MTPAGALCRKGWSAAGLHGGRDRLATPLVRDRGTGEWSALGWDDALDLVADSVAVFGGGGLTNEKAWSTRSRWPSRGCGRRWVPVPCRRW